MNNKAASFQQNLHKDMQKIRRYFNKNQFSDKGFSLGAELEFFVLDQNYQLAENNLALIQESGLSETCPEACSSSVEIQSKPYELNDNVFDNLLSDLQHALTRYHKVIQQHHCKLAMIGLLPHLQLNQPLEHIITNTQRNHQLINADHYATLKPSANSANIRLPDIRYPIGLGCSFQLHLKIPISQSLAFYSAMLFAAAILVAVSSNSPIIANQSAWHESRIPYYEYLSDRFYFNSIIPKHSLFDFFAYQHQHFTPALMQLSEKDLQSSLPYFNSFTSSIYPWIRPVIGYEESGQPHCRLEFRVMPCSAHLTDMLANTVLWLATLQWTINHIDINPCHLNSISNNFYKAAQYGVNANISIPGQRSSCCIKDIISLILADLPEQLSTLNLSHNIAKHWLDIISHKLNSYLTCARWQLNNFQENGNNTNALIAEYLNWQNTDYAKIC